MKIFKRSDEKELQKKRQVVEIPLLGSKRAEMYDYLALIAERGRGGRSESILLLGAA
jgi:hypothetical protein